jgi:hypothetical protein
VLVLHIKFNRAMTYDHWKTTDHSDDGANMPELGDAPIEQKYRETMKGLAGFIDGFFNGPTEDRPRKTGFVLLTFDFGDSGRCNYISNAHRDDVVVLLREQLRRFEGSPDVTGRA